MSDGQVLSETPVDVVHGDEGLIHDIPPTMKDLRPGEEWIVQLQRNQLGPGFPPAPCVYRYFRAGNRLFRARVEEVD